MPNRPQTIQIFLAEGEPTGIKLAEVTNRAIQAIVVPRIKIDEISKKRVELKSVGLYFLFGEDPTKVKVKAYIGEAESCLKRLKDHNNKKDFWTHAVIMISQKSAFTKGHVKYLEYLSVKTALETNRFDLSENINTPSMPFVPEPLEADLLDYFETIKLLLSTLGYPIFSPLAITKTSSKDVFYINSVGVKAKGQYTNEGMVILKGSEARAKEAPTCRGYISELRSRLINEKVLVKENKKYVFTQSYLVSSPSTASNIIIGSSTNGWDRWKNSEGKTLDEKKRK